MVQSRMMIWAITFSWLHLLLIVTVRNSAAGNKYQQNPGMAGFTCPAASLDFGLAVSSMACAAECSKVAPCRGFFYSKMDGVCLGTPDVISSSTGCVSKTGTLYFQTTDMTTTTSTTATTTTTATTSTTTTTLPPGQYRDLCSTDAQCIRSFSMCLQGSCSCQAGYRHESASGSCVANCTTYGSTYIRYPDMFLNVPYIKYPATLANCSDLCTASPTCRGFEFCCTASCALMDRTPLTDPNMTQSILGDDYYSRNCV